jgi:molybdopterin-containing oxidoreductase family iron-sulfur binding subunit
VSGNTHHTDAYRRRFLGGLGAFAAAALGGGLLVQNVARARAPDEAVTGAQRWGMLIDTTKCADGCDECVKACHVENGVTGHGRPETDAQWIRKVTLREKATGRTAILPMLCQHCEHPPCVDVCPTGASFRRVDGIVLVDKHLCIGCRYCMMACPYKARSFIHEATTDQKAHAPRGKGTVESCTLCVHRVDRGETTVACQDACTKSGHDAILFGDLNDPNSEIAKRLASEPSTQVRGDLGLNLGVRYQGI